MNALVVGPPTEGALAVARMLNAAGGPLTLVSSDSDGLLAALDDPALAGVDVLWADPSSGESCDDAIVHRRMLHPAPDGVVLVIDDRADWALAAEIVRRLPDVPWVATGTGVASVADEVAAFRAGRDDGDLSDVVPGAEPGVIGDRLAALRAEALSRPAPEVLPRTGTCCH